MSVFQQLIFITVSLLKVSIIGLEKNINFLHDIQQSLSNFLRKKSCSVNQSLFFHRSESAFFHFCLLLLFWIPIICQLKVKLKQSILVKAVYSQYILMIIIRHNAYFSYAFPNNVGIMIIFIRHIQAQAVIYNLMNIFEFF